jgi:hypothetical protein
LVGAAVSDHARRHEPAAQRSGTLDSHLMPQATSCQAAGHNGSENAGKACVVQRRAF